MNAAVRATPVTAKLKDILEQSSYQQGGPSAQRRFLTGRFRKTVRRLPEFSQ